MYTLKLNNEIKYFKPGDKVLDLIPIDEQKQYMVCKINESIKELTYPLSEKLNNCEITLLKLDHLESGRAYEATLRYIISMAFANLYPNTKPSKPNDNYAPPRFRNLQYHTFSDHCAPNASTYRPKFENPQIY